MMAYHEQPIPAFDLPGRRENGRIRSAGRSRNYLQHGWAAAGATASTRIIITTAPR